LADGFSALCSIDRQIAILPPPAAPNSGPRHRGRGRGRRRHSAPARPLAPRPSCASRPSRPSPLAPLPLVVESFRAALPRGRPAKGLPERLNAAAVGATRVPERLNAAAVGATRHPPPAARHALSTGPVGLHRHTPTPRFAGSGGQAGGTSSSTWTTPPPPTRTSPPSPVTARR